MSDYNSISLHGDVHPFIQKKTRTSTQVEKSSGDRNPWDQAPGESAKAYSAFLIYLDLGANNRSQSKVAKIVYGKETSIGNIQKWSVDHDWLNRADSWDRYCAEARLAKMEDAVKESEDIMLSYLPKVILNLSQAAAGEKTVGRSEMRAISDFLDRVGPAKQQRSAPAVINNNLTVTAPSLPSQVIDDTSSADDAEIIQDEAEKLIPEDLRHKKG